MTSRFMLLIPLLLLAACETNLDLPNGEQAYSVIPAAGANEAVSSYRIGPLDTIAVSVFQEPDLSSHDLQVDAAGKVFIPLAGEIQASGETTTELAREITRIYAAHYLENPQVTVSVQDSVSQRVTVEGSVTEAGVYEIKGHTTLLDALAMAKGLSRTAKTDQVAVFRTVDGRRVGALFNVDRISRGLSPDPEIHGNDLIMVGNSNIRQAWLDILTASPLISAVRP